MGWRLPWQAVVSTAETDVNVGAPSRKAVLEKHVEDD